MTIDMTRRFDNLEAAEAKAQELTEQTGELHVAYKSSYVCDPFVAARLPQVGDEVSMGFNGDYYPLGKITRISKTYSRITTESGRVFTRVGPVSWKEGGKRGAFSLVQGKHDERNPHF